MMDDNDVCPLCCEELDMSDRQFFPCKCGYQVCMWCWHRIRESESGLCPACRTPYGDDPHEFSAVDMEEVVKANKEKAAAEKRERERMRQQQLAPRDNSSSASVGSAGSFGVEVREDTLPVGGSGRPLDPPKDRNQLANMRVIRRNLVYAVGLPPSIATEETLRKPEYFGEYGKISKIVLNRNHNGNGDPRRASASAYVTFAHKEDTLACILALDGFYLDGRNIRASYGTSKYCSAFIKSVRCNNPDCTYLHGMGDTEDTFTKQEIQAGYVTSGRDVLARQQQQMAAQGNSGNTTRRRVGGGGPSGSGRVPSTPIFPPPCFDEPAKAERPSPPSFPMARSNAVSAAGGFASAAAIAPAPAPTKQRSASLTMASPAAEKLSRQQEQLRRMHPQSKPAAKKGSNGTTAAAVVAGSTPPPPPSAPVNSLTALTPLKRSSSLPASTKEKNSSKPKSQTDDPQPSIEVCDVIESPSQPIPMRNKEQSRIINHEANLARQREIITVAPVAAIGSQKRDPGFEGNMGGFIGGSVLMGGMPGGPYGALPGLSVGGSLGMTPGLIGGHIHQKQDGLMGINSGNPFEGRSPAPEQDPFRKNDKWDGDSLSSNSFGSGHLFGNNSFGLSSGGIPSGGISSVGIWGDSSSAPPPAASTVPPSPLFSLNNPPPARAVEPPFPPAGAIGAPLLNKNPFSHNDPGTGVGSGTGTGSGSSALASMLGIDLPTGSGTLRERETHQNIHPQTAAHGYGFDRMDRVAHPDNRGGLWGAAPHGSIRPTGQGMSMGGNSSPNARAVAPQQPQPQGVIGGPRPGQQNSDIALLQSLLPGVHITSGNAHQPAAPSQGWNHGQQSREQEEKQDDTWGLFGGQRGGQHQGMNSQTSIW